MIRKFLLVLLICLLALPLFAGGKSEEPKETEPVGMEGTINDPGLFQPGKLTVATGEPAYPPWMMDDDPASGIGFENAMVYALAAELGFDRSDTFSGDKVCGRHRQVAGGAAGPAGADQCGD